MVLRTISQSDDEAQKFHGKQIHKPMEYTFLDYFHFCLVKSTVLRHICHIYDHLVDKIQTSKPYVENYNPNKAINKSPGFFYLDLQVIGLLGLRGLLKALTLNHINSFVSFLLE